MRAVVLALLAVQASAITLQILANGEISGETNVTLPDDSTLTGDRLADLLAGSLPWCVPHAPRTRCAHDVGW